MTRKQITALQRILAREAAEYQVRSGHPVPGQHPSGDKYTVTDGITCVLLDTPAPTLPMGEQADTFFEIVQKERKNEAHFPVPSDQISASRWRGQTKQQRQGVELSAPILYPEQLRVDDLGTAAAPTVIKGQFDPQLLVDAAEAVGSEPLLFLGYGPFNKHFPSLLVMPPTWTEFNCTKPIALVLSMRV